LGDVEIEGAQRSMERFRLKAIGIALSCWGALVGFGFKNGRALQKHGFVEEHLKELGEGAGAFFGKKLEKIVKEVIFGIRVGHGRARVGWVEVYFSLSNLTCRDRPHPL
jgi:hypothetical protein